MAAILTAAQPESLGFVEASTELEPLLAAESDPGNRRADIIIDSTFTGIYFICFVAVIAIATRNFIKFPNMVNRANIFVVMLLSLTLLSKCSLSKWSSLVQRLALLGAPK